MFRQRMAQSNLLGRHGLDHIAACERNTWLRHGGLRAVLQKDQSLPCRRKEAADHHMVHWRGCWRLGLWCVFFVCLHRRCFDLRFGRR